MARLTIDFPDSVAQRVLDAYAAMHGYDPASGQTKAQFLKADISAYIKDSVRRYEGGTAGTQAQQTARTKVDQEITLS